MMLVTRIHHSNRRYDQRRAAITVELAIVAPIFLAITLGVAQVSRLFDMQNMLSMATRDAARLAAMDREGMLPAGTTLNQKMADDVKAFLKASGIPTTDVTVKIADHANPSQTINLDDPANNFKLFDMTVELPYSSFSSMPVPEGQNFKISSKIVFKNGRAP